MQGERIAYPLNAVEIKCWKSDAQCIAAHSQLSLAATANSANALLGPIIEHYEIQTWQPNEVTARMRTVCRQIVLTINTSTKSVFTVATDLTAEGCPVVGKLERPRVVTLEDGFKFVPEQNKERWKELSAFPIARYRERIKSMAPKP